jgi:DNA invertase Pin-like site-specific DNA recombinase
VYMQIGYSRVSTDDQNLDLQTDDLNKAGCEKIFSDVASGAKSERVGLAQAVEFARKGDVIVCWKLDRLGRSLQHLIETVKKLDAKGVGFRSLRESIDTNTPGGKLVFHLFGALAEFERDLIRERTGAGLASARARGRLGGRPKVVNSKKAKMVATMHADPLHSVPEICDTLGISKATFYRHLKSQRVEAASAESV